MIKRYMTRYTYVGVCGEGSAACAEVAAGMDSVHYPEGKGGVDLKATYQGSKGDWHLLTL